MSRKALIAHLAEHYANEPKISMWGEKEWNNWECYEQLSIDQLHYNSHHNVLLRINHTHEGLK
jgi:hypothetical protein